MRTAEITRCQPWLGTFVEVTGTDDKATAAAFDAVEQVHSLMNRHDPHSELSEINRRAHFGPVLVHPWTAAVLLRALHWARASDGVFDPMTGSASWRDVELAGRSVRLARQATLDLGGIAKGFAVDRAVAAMQAAGATQGLVNAGGDMRGFGPRIWSIFVVDPATRLPAIEIPLDNMALATSGVLPDGRDGHLPRRARGVVSASVLARCACDADALAKIAIAGGTATRACLKEGAARALIMTGSGEVSEWPLAA